jgi:L-ascorbate metabolism protein UlaG (beta-lactamase superfamily)
LDPYTDVTGHADVQTEAHEVLCSHGHYDHSAVSGVALLPEKASPFVIRRVKTCHDEQGGALRGENTVHILEAGGVSVAHLGDLGHQLTREQLEEIGRVDGILVPVGGTYTVDAAGAKKVCEAVNPKWVIPMHYRHGSYGFPVLLTVEEFAALWPEVTRNDSAELEIKPEQTGLVILKFD